MAPNRPTPHVRLIAGLALLLVCLPVLARADDPPRSGDAGRSAVRDTARLFGAEAVREAARVLAEAEERTGVPTIVETIASLEGDPVDRVTQRRAQQSGIRGVFVLIARQETKIDVESTGSFLGRERTTAIRDAFIDGFRQRNFDDGLRRGAERIAAALREPGITLPRQPEAGGPLVRRDAIRLNLAGARKALAGAEAKAAELNLKANIAVVDDGGHLLTFARTDGARPASVSTAITKAVTAATFRQATGPLSSGSGASGPPDILLNLSLQNAAAASGGRITTLLGGVPIVVDDQVIGAVGVGGGTGEQDAEVARAGVQALLRDLKGGPAAPAEGGRPRADR